MRRRELLALGLGALSANALTASAAFAQSRYPERPIRLVIPYPPGGVYDATGRPWAEKAKSLDPKKVAEAMHSGTPFHTVIGDIAYDKKGDRTTVDYVWYVWKKGADGKISYEQIGS